MADREQYEAWLLQRQRDLGYGTYLTDAEIRAGLERVGLLEFGWSVWQAAYGVNGMEAPAQTIQGYRVDATYFQKWGSIPVALRDRAIALYAHPAGVNAPAAYAQGGVVKGDTYVVGERPIEETSLPWPRPDGVKRLNALTADAEQLCWALRPLVRMVPVGDKLRWVRFKVGPQEFTISNEPMPEDEAAHFAGLFVFALAAAFRTLPAGVTACPHGVPHRWPCEKCDASGVMGKEGGHADQT